MATLPVVEEALKRFLGGWEAQGYTLAMRDDDGSLFESCLTLEDLAEEFARHVSQGA